jgi:DNA-binding IclR family transcriptional regulator
LDAGYVRSERSPDPVQDDAVPMEIGRQILLCLTEPRRTRDIARIINRPPSNTTGQLQHLLRRGLVVRISKGVYDIAPSSRKSGPAAQGAERSRTSAQLHPSMERPGSGASLSHSDGA